jgi:NTE family protein
MMSAALLQGAAREPIQVDLALQGGGSHGAFTWGVLDRLLEEPWLQIEAISGTSAGAMNAAVLAHGWTQGGAEGARAALDAYWQRVSRAAASSPLQRSPLDRLMGRWTLDTSPAYVAMDLMARVLSPYDLNPFGLNPLRAILPFPDSCTAAKQLLNSFVGPCSAISMHVEEPRHG